MSRTAAEILADTVLRREEEIEKLKVKTETQYEMIVELQGDIQDLRSRLEKLKVDTLEELEIESRCWDYNSYSYTACLGSDHGDTEGEECDSIHEAIQSLVAKLRKEES